MDTPNDIPIHESSGNVFADLGFENADELMKATEESVKPESKRHTSVADMMRDATGDDAFADRLVESIARTHIVSGLMVRRAAAGVSETDFMVMSGLTREQFEAIEYSEDRDVDVDLLIRYAVALATIRAVRQGTEEAKAGLLAPAPDLEADAALFPEEDEPTA